VARVVVIGGGIAGLAAADEIAGRVAGVEVILLEASNAVGGKLRLGELAGQVVDVGAEALLARRPEGIGLARRVGLAQSMITPLTTSAQVFADGAPHRLPANTLMGIPSDVESARVSGVLTDDALARIEAEPGLEPLAPLEHDVAVGALVRERLGREVLERLVEPLLGGVYAGRADQLSLRATVPGLAARLASVGGSVVEAVRTVTANGARATSTDPVFVSVRGGLGTLASATAARGLFTVRTGVTVRTITRTPTGFALECGPVPAPERIEADAVVVAAPAAKASVLLADVVPSAAAELAEIEYSSMAIVSLAFRDVVPPQGSGLLIGDTDQAAVKAVTISSQKWPGTPPGLTLLRASVGRIGDTRLLQLEAGELVGVVRDDLVRLTGITAAPIDSLVTRWGGGLPQYAVGHAERVVRIRTAVEAVPGLAVCGAAYDGVGIPACIGSARRAADHVLRSSGTLEAWSTANRHANSTTSSATPPGRCSR
jgi:oxygen-dependent protoporphyrinogen oxidase